VGRGCCIELRAFEVYVAMCRFFERQTKHLETILKRRRAMVGARSLVCIGSLILLGVMLEGLWRPCRGPFLKIGPENRK